MNVQGLDRGQTRHRCRRTRKSLHPGRGRAGKGLLVGRACQDGRGQRRARTSHEALHELTRREIHAIRADIIDERGARVQRSGTCWCVTLPTGRSRARARVRNGTSGGRGMDGAARRAIGSEDHAERARLPLFGGAGADRGRWRGCHGARRTHTAFLVLSAQRTANLDPSRSEQMFDRALELAPADHPDRAAIQVQRAKALLAFSRLPRSRTCAYPSSCVVPRPKRLLARCREFSSCWPTRAREPGKTAGTACWRRPRPCSKGCPRARNSSPRTQVEPRGNTLRVCPAMASRGPTRRWSSASSSETPGRSTGHAHQRGGPLLRRRPLRARRSPTVDRDREGTREAARCRVLTQRAGECPCRVRGPCGGDGRA